MDFSWSEEQQQLRDGAQKFGASLNEGLAHRYKDAAFPRQLWDRCAEFGLQGMPVPGELGGGGHSALDMVAILEGVGLTCRDNGLIFSIGAHLWACETPLLLFGTDEQKQRHLRPMASGELIGANAMTEPDSGSDAYALRTTAVKDGDGYVLNGTKTFVTNGPVADLFITYGRTGGKGFAGITGFLVERGTPGLTVGPAFDKMGLRTSPMCEIAFEDCRVPKANILGRVGSGSFVFNSSMEWERLMIMASALGTMEHLLDRCTAYIKERGVSKHQAVAHKLVDMELRLESARAALYRAAWLKEVKGAAMRESAMAKVTASEAYVHACRDAIQLHGAYGFMVEYELERELRDATASTLYSGTSEVQRNIIAALKGL